VEYAQMAPPSVPRVRVEQRSLGRVCIAPFVSRANGPTATWSSRLETMTTIRLRSQGLVMPEAADFLQKWVRENITPTTAHVRDDTLTAGRLVEECLWEAQGENLSAAEVIDAAGGNLLTFMVSELNRAADA